MWECRPRRALGKIVARKSAWYPVKELAAPLACHWMAINVITAIILLYPRFYFITLHHSSAIPNQALCDHCSEVLSLIMDKCMFYARLRSWLRSDSCLVYFALVFLKCNFAFVFVMFVVIIALSALLFSTIVINQIVNQESECSILFSTSVMT